MHKIKVSELFYSLQGEGRHTGVPSVFLRTFGCNFTCSGFGMPKGEASKEADQVAINFPNIEKYEDLPLVATGCDSYASWHPKFKHLSPTLDTHEIATRILSLLPYRTWNDEHLVITGGEPLLGWQRAYPELLEHNYMRKLKELTFETNGTQPLTDEFESYLIDWCNGPMHGRSYDSLTFSVSPKLSCSGEDQNVAIQPEVVLGYQEVGRTYLKFVVATEEDIEEAKFAIQEYRFAGFTGNVYLMPVGGVEHVYTLNNKRVADAAMKLGVRYSDRLQVALWKNQWGT